MPVVDQVECHPYAHVEELRQELKKINCLIEAWSPFGRGSSKFSMKKFLKNYQKNILKLILR